MLLIFQIAATNFLFCRYEFSVNFSLMGFLFWMRPSWVVCNEIKFNRKTKHREKKRNAAIDRESKISKYTQKRNNFCVKMNISTIWNNESGKSLFPLPDSKLIHRFSDRMARRTENYVHIKTNIMVQNRSPPHKHTRTLIIYI